MYISKASTVKKKKKDYETFWKETIANVIAAKNHYDFNMPPFPRGYYSCWPRKQL